jgi:predicted dehydrogenase
LAPGFAAGGAALIVALEQLRHDVGEELAGCSFGFGVHGAWPVVGGQNAAHHGRGGVFVAATQDMNVGAGDRAGVLVVGLAAEPLIDVPTRPTDTIRPAQDRDVVGESSPTSRVTDRAGASASVAFVSGNGAAPLRIGILGAARIAPLALIKPAKGNVEVVVAAVAARDAARAQAFAAKHGIARVHESYETLIADPDLDAIYIPLPNGLHGRWIRAALGTGKHVLCEKPFTANAAEAREIAELAAKSDRVVMEAFHYRYHPLALRVEQIIASGELGTLERVEAALCFPLPKFSDIRYNYSLAGGATMDAGCYAVHMARTFGGGTPEVVSAQAKLRDPQIDRAMTAELRFPGGHTGRVRCSMWSSDLLQVSARVVGDHGELRVFNPITPQFFHRLSVRSADGKRVERFRRRASYAYQLDAFAAAVLRGEPVKTTPEDAIENMTVIDAIYRAAGLPLREPS